MSNCEKCRLWEWRDYHYLTGFCRKYEEFKQNSDSCDMMEMFPENLLKVGDSNDDLRV